MEPQFIPSSWLHYAKVLDAAGYETEARSVRIETERRQTKLNVKRQQAHGNSPWRIWIYKKWRAAYKWLTGYGHAPWQALYPMAGLFVLGFVLFWTFESHMTPSKERLYLQSEYANYQMGDSLPKGYPEFNAIVYSADVMLPVVDFGQESHWRPRNVAYRKLNLLRWYNRLHLAFGWFFSTIAILGFTGLIRGRKEP